MTAPARGLVWDDEPAAERDWRMFQWPDEFMPHDLREPESFGAQNNWRTHGVAPFQSSQSCAAMGNFCAIFGVITNREASE
jgi:hypothetical protein